MQTIQTAFTLGKTVLPRTAVLAPMAGVADRVSCIFSTAIISDITFVIEAGYILVSACLPAISWLLVTSRSAT